MSRPLLSVVRQTHEPSSPLGVTNSRSTSNPGGTAKGAACRLSDRLPVSASPQGPSPPLATTFVATGLARLSASTAVQFLPLATVRLVPSALTIVTRQEKPAAPPALATTAASSLSPSRSSSVISTDTGFSQESLCATCVPLTITVIELSAVATRMADLAPP